MSNIKKGIRFSVEKNGDGESIMVTVSFKAPPKEESDCLIKIFETAKTWSKGGNFEKYKAIENIAEKFPENKEMVYFLKGVLLSGFVKKETFPREIAWDPCDGHSFKFQLRLNF